MLNAVGLRRSPLFGGRTVCAASPFSARCAVLAPTVKLHAYHSYEHAAAPVFTPTSQTILSAALKHVPEHGFTQEALRLGARDVDYLPISTNLFPQGAFDLISYYLTTRRQLLHERARIHTQDRSEPVSATDVSLGVRKLLLDRLAMNAEAGVVQRWPEALAIMAQPSYVSPSLAELGRLADDIWFLAGDKSVDTSWYTKRASLCALYAAAEIHQTQDSSPQFKETKEFVDCRLSDLKSLRAGLDSTAEWLNFSGRSFLNVLRSKGIRV